MWRPKPTQPPRCYFLLLIEVYGLTFAVMGLDNHDFHRRRLRSCISSSVSKTSKERTMIPMILLILLFHNFDTKKHGVKLQNFLFFFCSFPYSIYICLEKIGESTWYNEWGNQTKWTTVAIGVIIYVKNMLCIITLVFGMIENCIGSECVYFISVCRIYDSIL